MAAGSALAAAAATGAAAGAPMLSVPVVVTVLPLDQRLVVLV